MKKILCIILLSLALCLPAFGQFNDSEPMFGQMLNLGHWSTDGLVFYWRGIEAGEVIDESLYRNNGTITGAAWVGDGLDFNGTSDLVSIPYKYNLAGSTIVVRFRKTGEVAGDVVTGSYGGAGDQRAPGLFVSDNDYKWEFGSFSAEDTGVNIVQGTWYTGAITWDSAWNVVVYLDGRVVDTGSSGDPGDFYSEVHLGHYANYGNLWFAGDIADFKIYNHPLSASELQQLYINPDLPMWHEPIWLMYSPVVVGGSLQWILDGGIGPSPLKGSVVR